MSLYPSLEDMQLDKMIQAQNQVIASATTGYPALSFSDGGQVAPKDDLYPNLEDYLGLELSRESMALNLPEYGQLAHPYQSAQAAINDVMVAPLSENSVGYKRTGVNKGIRELILCKDASNKVGLRAQAVNKGIFVSLVVKNSPAALGGLRFGDQILQINGQVVAGYSMDDVHKLLKKSDSNNISVIVRPRPFETVLVLHKDSKGTVGFQFKDSKITAIVKDSSAAKNGLLIDHNILEVNGQNVIGLKDKEITKLIDEGGQTITLTTVPNVIYETMIKK
jgi:syntenin-1